MTLFTATKSDGTKRTCDAKCYNAKGLKCTCICGGVNHGVGFRRALQNDLIYLLDAEDLAKYSFRRHPVQMRLIDKDPPHIKRGTTQTA